MLFRKTCLHTYLLRFSALETQLDNLTSPYSGTTVNRPGFLNFCGSQYAGEMIFHTVLAANYGIYFGKASSAPFMFKHELRWSLSPSVGLAFGTSYQCMSDVTTNLFWFNNQSSSAVRLLYARACFCVLAPKLCSCLFCRVSKG